VTTPLGGGACVAVLAGRLNHCPLQALLRRRRRGGRGTRVRAKAGRVADGVTTTDRRLPGWLCSWREAGGWPSSPSHPLCIARATPAPRLSGATSRTRAPGRPTRCRSAGLLRAASTALVAASFGPSGFGRRSQRLSVPGWVRARPTRRRVMRVGEAPVSPATSSRTIAARVQSTGVYRNLRGERNSFDAVANAHGAGGR
jgi:hypothetical protein